MVVDLDLLYLYVASVFILASTLTSASEVNISNSNNSLIFQVRRLKFCMVVVLDLLYLYLASELTHFGSISSDWYSVLPCDIQKWNFKPFVLELKSVYFQKAIQKQSLVNIFGLLRHLQIPTFYWSQILGMSQGKIFVKDTFPRF